MGPRTGCTYRGHRRSWLVVDVPLWKIWLRQLGWWNSQDMEKQKPCSKTPTSWRLLDLIGYLLLPNHIQIIKHISRNLGLLWFFLMVSPQNWLNGGIANSWDSHDELDRGRFQSLPLFCIQKCLIGFVDFEKKTLRGWIIIATIPKISLTGLTIAIHSFQPNMQATQWPLSNWNCILHGLLLGLHQSGKDTRAVDMIPGHKTGLWRGGQPGSCPDNDQWTCEPEIKDFPWIPPLRSWGFPVSCPTYPLKWRFQLQNLKILTNRKAKLLENMSFLYRTIGISICQITKGATRYPPICCLIPHDVLLPPGLQRYCSILKASVKSLHHLQISPWPAQILKWFLKSAALHPQLSWNDQMSK